MKIRVTHNDIERGIRNSPYHCAIAKALQRRFPKSDDIIVRAQAIFAHGTMWRVNKEIMAFMHDFDNGLQVKPRTFNLVKLRGQNNEN